MKYTIFQYTKGLIIILTSLIGLNFSKPYFDQIDHFFVGPQQKNVRIFICKEK